MQIDPHLCRECKTCISACPTWAISAQSESKINIHACNGCMDCTKVCSQGAIAYRANKAVRKAVPAPAGESSVDQNRVEGNAP